MQEYLGAMGASVYPPIMYTLTVGISLLVIKGIEHYGDLITWCQQTMGGAAELWANLLRRGVKNEKVNKQ